MPGRFGAVLTAMATPFKDDLSLDLDGARALATHLLAHGSDGLVISGTTGESPTLTEAEKQALFEAIAEVAPGKMICGTGTYSTAESIELTQMAEKAGAAAALVVTPYYNKPPQRALVEHFRMIADSTALPVLLYNIPGRTVTRIDHDTLLTLAAVENIVGVKDAIGDYAAVSKLIAETPDSFEVYAGSDEDTFGYACLGGAGVISVASHFAGERMGEMIRLVESGEVARARAIHEDLLPLIDALFCTTSPIPLKAGLAMAGLPGGPLRPPMFEATPSERETVRKALANAGIL